MFIGPIGRIGRNRNKDVVGWYAYLSLDDETIEKPFRIAFTLSSDELFPEFRILMREATSDDNPYGISGLIVADEWMPLNEEHTIVLSRVEL